MDLVLQEIVTDHKNFRLRNALHIREYENTEFRDSMRPSSEREVEEPRQWMQRDSFFGMHIVNLHPLYPLVPPGC